MSGETAQTPYRQAALDRLSSPEQLDRLLVVVRPSDWLAMTAFAILALTALAWSLFGTVATRVEGNGILVGAGGHIFTPVANGDGMIQALSVSPGQRVRVGQKLARIDQPDLVDALATARAAADDYEVQLRALGGQVVDYAGARRNYDVAQRTLLMQERDAAIARSQAVAQQLAAAESLLARGIVVRARIDELQQQLAAARQAVTEAGSRIVRMGADEVSARNQDDREVRALQSRLAEARRRQRDTAAELERRQWVLSPVAGRVIEIKTPLGSRVSVGMPVVAVENGAAALQLMLYVPPRDGKMVRRGMLVHVSPSVSRREEYGTMIGRVVEVSDFPATQQAMLATLQNAELVTEFSARGAPIAARIALEPDRRTPSGYRWAGGSGPPMALSSGTLAGAEITVRRQSPISFVIPMLRRSSGL